MKKSLKKTGAWVAWKAEVEKEMTLRRWSRADLAKAIGMSRIYVANTICGSVRSVHNVDRISKELGIKPFEVEVQT